MDNAGFFKLLSLKNVFYHYFSLGGRARSNGMVGWTRAKVYRTRYRAYQNRCPDHEKGQTVILRSGMDQIETDRTAITYRHAGIGFADVHDGRVKLSLVPVSVGYHATRHQQAHCHSRGARHFGCCRSRGGTHGAACAHAKYVYTY